MQEQTQVEVGVIVEGRVTGITDFGAFVALPDKKSGMVHISEISRDYVKSIKDYLKLDQTVKVKIISINENGKIALSIKQTLETAPKPTATSLASSVPPVEFRPYTKQTADQNDSFESMMSHFKKLSEDRLSDYKRASEVKRNSSKRKQYE